MFFNTLCMCRCLGTTQHLKDKYGGGYILEVKLQMRSQENLEERIDALHEYVRSILPNAEVTENFGERLTFKLPKKSVASLSAVFAAMEKGMLKFWVKGQCMMYLGSRVIIMSM